MNVEKSIMSFINKTYLNTFQVSLKFRKRCSLQEFKKQGPDFLRDLYFLEECLIPNNIIILKSIVMESYHFTDLKRIVMVAIR